MEQKYVAMTIEKAMKMTKRDAVVLVAVNDLEDQMNIGSFSKKTFIECEQMIKEAETIMSVCDDFIKSLRCYTARQENFPELIGINFQKWKIFPNMCSKST